MNEMSNSADSIHFPLNGYKIHCRMSEECVHDSIDIIKVFLMTQFHAGQEVYKLFGLKNWTGVAAAAGSLF